MDNQKLKILFLENSPQDVELVSSALMQWNFELKLADSKEKFVQELKEFLPDVILMDYSCSILNFNLTVVQDILKKMGLNIPFILLTDPTNEDEAIIFLKNGGTDYVLKDQLKRLPNSIFNAVKLFKINKLYKETELRNEKYNAIIQNLPANIALLNRDGVIVDVNNSWKSFADDNAFKGSNYGIGSNYIEIARQKSEIDNGEGSLIADAIEQILLGKINNFSLIYPCHSPFKRRWFKAILSLENDTENSGVIVMHIDVTEQHEAQLKVQQSDANFLSIFNNTDTAFILLDTDLKIVSANKVANLWANTTTGIDRLEELSLISLTSEKRQKRLKSILKKILKGFVFDKEVGYRLLNGEKKWFRVKIHSVNDNMGVVIGLCLSAVDITDQVLSRKKLEESENRFKSIAEQASEGITLIDLSGNYVFVNHAFCKMTGYSEAELLKMNMYDFEVPEDERHKVLKKGLKPKQVSIKAKKLLCKDNSIIAVDINGKIIKINGESFLISIINDVTDQLKNELELIRAKVHAEENEAKLIEAQNAAKVGSWETDLSTMKVIWSEETYKIFELDSGSFLPTHELFLTFVHPDDVEKVNQAFIDSFNSKDYSFIEHRIITAKGNLKYVEERWKILFNEEELPVSTFGTCQDITERKKVELELINTKIKAEENEFRLKLAAESACLGVWDWNIKENILTWDDIMYSIFGIQDKINTNLLVSWVDSLHPEDREKTLEDVNAALNGEKNFDTSFRIIKPNGSIAFIKADGLVFRNSHGVAERMIGINRDVTEQTQIDEKLIKSKDRLIKILQNSPIASCLAKLDHSVVFYNNEFTNLFGYDIDDVPDLDHWWLLAYPDEAYREAIKEEWFLRMKSAQTAQSQFVPMEAKVRCKDGSDRFIEFYYAKIDDEYLVNFNDISERIKYEEQLALSALIVDSSNDAIISNSLDGIVTSWNVAAERLLGYTAQEIIGKPITTFIPAELVEEEKEIMAKIRSGKSVYHLETKRKRKDGVYIDISLTISSILDVKGNVRGVSKILRDITYQKRIELEREKTINDLLERNRDLEQFSYIISHNLRGPVATILGLTNLMNDMKLNKTERERIIKGLSSSVNNLDSVIKDLNRILQVKAPSSEMKKRIQFSDILNEVELSLADVIQNENVLIRSNFDAINEIQILKSYIYSIFYNLVLNSIKYRKPNYSPVIEITSKLMGRDVILTFKDNGIGIDMEKHGHEVFGLNKRFSFNIEGKGLGLFMVKTQIESLGGTVSVESFINRGSEFTIKFENYV